MGRLKIRAYLIFDNSIKRIGLNSKKRFKEAASKIIPSLWIHSRVEGESEEITRMYLTNLAFDENGVNTLNEIEVNYALEAMEQAIFGQNEQSNVAHFKNRNRIKLNERQKDLIVKRLIKDYGSAWHNLNPQAKLSFWQNGDTHVTNR